MMKRTGIHHLAAKFPKPGIPNSDVLVNSNRTALPQAMPRERRTLETPRAKKVHASPRRAASDACNLNL
jgi:hypothetical protein